MNFWLVLVVKDISTIYYILCFMKKLFLLFTLLIISATVQAQVFTIDNNGIVKCPTATPGQKGTIFGEEYEAVDRALLEQRRDQGADLSYVCTSLVTDMSNLFRDKNFNQPIGNWDVSKVTNMSYMFLNSNFNQDISLWDVSSLVDMKGMFWDNILFNSDITLWDVSNVEYMNDLFRGANLFNRDLNNWDVSSVRNMSYMFAFNQHFNGGVETWDVSKVVNMQGMFQHAKSFNKDISTWDVSSVSNMSEMFKGAEKFNANIGLWNVSNVRSMNSMFEEAKNFNQNLNSWNVSKVTTMNGMFLRASSFVGSLKDWDVSNVIDMKEMLAEASSFIDDLSSWDVSSVVNMSNMFRGVNKFNSDIGSWNVSSVVNMNQMFWSADSFNADIGSWNVSSVLDMNGMFWNGASFNQDLTGWCVINIKNEDVYFAAGSILAGYNKPLWGTCPGRPATVSLVSPSNNQTSVSYTPTLSWNEADGALEYELEVLLGNRVILTEKVTGTSYTFESPLNGNTFYRWRVRGKNDSGNPLGEWSTIWRFLTELAPVGQVTLTHPLSEATNVTPYATLSWQADPNASSYSVEVSIDGFDSVLLSSSTTSTTFTTPRLPLNTLISWRVLASNSLGDGPWSEVRTFTTSQYPIPATGTTYFVSTDGNDSSGDGTEFKPYRSIQVAIDNMEPSSETNTILVFPGIYVGAIDVRRSVNIESIEGPSTTTLVRPLDIYTHITVNGGFNFSNEASFTLTGFKLIGSEDDSRNGTAIRTEQAAFTQIKNSFVKNYNVALSTYYGYYRVENSIFTNNGEFANNDVGNTDKRSKIIHSTIHNSNVITWTSPSIINEFYNTIIVNDADKQYTDPSFNGARVLLKNVVMDRTYSNPLTGSVVTEVPDVRYVGFVDPENGDFRLQDFSAAIGAGAAFDGAPLLDFYGATRPNPDGSNPDAGAIENALSAPESLGQPGKVNLVSPTISAVGISLTPELKWNKLDPVTGYRVVVSTVQDLSDQIIFDQTVTDTTVVITALEQNTQYYWQVKAQNGFLTGESSEIWSFTTAINPVEQVTLGQPDNDVVVSPYQLLFTWNRDSNANSYDLEISADNFESFVVQESLTDTSFATSELAFTTAYQWRVRASNGAGNGEWSSVRTFTTGQPIPGLIYPGNGLTGLYPALTFEWTSLESATSYGFELRNAATEEVIYSVESIAATQLSTTETMVEIGGESVTLASLLEYDASYQWRVRLYDTNNPGEWSEYATFSMIDSQTATLSFNMGITVTSGEISIPLRIGARSDATSGFDVNIDQTAPPEAPEGIDARLLRDGEFYFEDFVNLTTTVSEWRMQLKRISGNDPISLSWNPEELPVSGSFVLTSEDRSTIRINMREQSSLEVNVPQQIELFIQHLVAGTGSITTTLSMNSGWNLIGLPASISHEEFTNIFTGSIEGTLYEFTNTYALRSQLQPGIGYWIRYPQTVSETLSGEFVSEVTWNLKKGWNLVSGPSSSVSVSSIVDPQNVLIPNTFFDFRSQYGNSTLLNPGRGYWVRTSDAGTVVVSSDVSAKSVGTTLFSESTPVNANVIHVMVQTDTTTLYWGGQLPAGLTAESFSLPPVPPSGVVDVRFDQDSRWVSDETAVIYVRQNQDPISIAVSPSELALNSNDTYQLIEYEDVILLGNSDLESGQVFTLSHRTTRVELSTSEIKPELPAVFTLDQNYPNPFNPTTTIRFGLPESADVSLEVYTVLGQKVMTLINENRSAGWHTVSFNGTGLSSGVYVYRIQAGGMVQTRKLMLVK
jgi:surface protein